MAKFMGLPTLSNLNLSLNTLSVNTIRNVPFLISLRYGESTQSISTGYHHNSDIHDHCISNRYNFGIQKQSQKIPLTFNPPINLSLTSKINNKRSFTTNSKLRYNDRYLNKAEEEKRIFLNKQRQILVNGLQNAIHERESSGPSITMMTLIILGTLFTILGSTITYQVINAKKQVFIPLWYKGIVRSPAPGEIDIERIKELITLRLLEKLSMNESSRETFGLPISLGLITELHISIEEQPRVWGVRISPTSPHFSWESKSISFEEPFRKLLTPIGIGSTTGANDTKTYHEIKPTRDKNKKKYVDYNILLTGKIEVKNSPKSNGNNDQLQGIIQFKGIIDPEHINTVRFQHADVVFYEKDGNTYLKELW